MSKRKGVSNFKYFVRRILGHPRTDFDEAVIGSSRSPPLCENDSVTGAPFSVPAIRSTGPQKLSPSTNRDIHNADVRVECADHSSPEACTSFSRTSADGEASGLASLGRLASLNVGPSSQVHQFRGSGLSRSASNETIDLDPQNHPAPRYDGHIDHKSPEDFLGGTPLTPKLTLRTNTFESMRTLNAPDTGQAKIPLRRLPSVGTSIGLNPYGHSLVRSLSTISLTQPLLQETPKLEDIFPLTIPAKCRIRFNANPQVRRILTDDLLDAVSVSDDDEAWSYETSVLDFPVQDIEWYKAEAYDALMPTKHMQKMIASHADLPENSLYIRHGCCRVEGPPELPQDLKYARINDVTELAQKSTHAICGFIHEHQFVRFHLDVFWEYSALQLSSSPDCPGQSFHKVIRKGLKSKMVTNFRNQEYIPRCDLIVFEKKDVIKNIIDQDPVLAKMSIDDGERAKLIQTAVAKASRLLLMCILVKRTIKDFQHVLEAHELDDDKMEEFVRRGHPTIDSRTCSREHCSKLIEKLYRCAPKFLPLKVGRDPRYKVWKDDMVIPLHFYDKGKPSVTSDREVGHGEAEARLIGEGGNGHVLKVWVEPSLHDLSGNLEQTYALKKASSTKARAFESEKKMLEKLYEYPHRHITAHYGSWQQDGHNYILLPRAKCNLRNYLTAGRPPELNTATVKWFFEQLHGLADAIKHVHHIKRPGTKMNPNPADDSYGYHHDIKPENILVFEKVANAHPLLQIADFGAGSLYDANANEVSRPVDSMRGTRTYFAPAGEPATRPVDMWSLGCCFLELTLWLFQTPGPEGNLDQFTEDRKHYLGHNPNDTEDGFWYRRPDGKIDVKAPVLERVNSLRDVYCKNMEVFQILLNAIRAEDGAKSLLTIDKYTRMDASHLVNCLDGIRKHIDLQERVDKAEGNHDPYAQHFRRNMNLSDEAAGGLLPMKIRTTLTTTDPSSPRDSMDEDEPVTPSATCLVPAQRQRSTSSLIVQAGRVTRDETQPDGSVLSDHGLNDVSTTQTSSLLHDGLQGDLDRMQLK